MKTTKDKGIVDKNIWAIIEKDVIEALDETQIVEIIEELVGCLYDKKQLQQVILCVTDALVYNAKHNAKYGDEEPDILESGVEK